MSFNADNPFLSRYLNVICLRRYQKCRDCGEEGKTIKKRMTSSGHHHVNKLLGISDVQRRHRYEAIRLPHFDLVGEADEVKVIARSQILQNGEQSIFRLKKKDK